MRRILCSTNASNAGDAQNPATGHTGALPIAKNEMALRTPLDASGRLCAVTWTGCIRQISPRRRRAEAFDNQAAAMARDHHLDGPPGDEGLRHLLSLFESREEDAENLTIDPDNIFRTGGKYRTSHLLCRFRE
jgi:hypothetical protein